MTDCSFCRYGRTINGEIFCYGQKNAPRVTEPCGEWEPRERMMVHMDERISEVLDALNMICAAAYRNGTQASLIEPQKGLIKRLLLAVDEDLTRRKALSLAEYQEQAKRTLPDMTLLDGITNAALGLSGEAGECADMIKKARYHGHPLEVTDLILELGDVLWYVAAAATAIGFPLEEVARRNIEKLQKRYPDGFDPERSIHRDERLEGAGFEV